MQAQQKTAPSLDASLQSIVIIASLTAAGDSEQLGSQLQGGLDAGLTVNEIKSVLEQLYAYCGFPRSLNAINSFMQVVEARKARGLSDPEGKSATRPSSQVDRYERGRKTLEQLTGQPQSKPAKGFGEFSPTIDRFLKEHLFADIFENAEIEIDSSYLEEYLVILPESESGDFAGRRVIFEVVAGLRLKKMRKHHSNIYAYFAVTEKQSLAFSRDVKGATVQERLATLPPVTLILADGIELSEKGRIETSSGLINTQTGSVSARAKFPNPGNIVRSGGSGTVRLPDIVDSALLIPQKATYEIQGKKIVSTTQNVTCDRTCDSNPSGIDDHQPLYHPTILHTFHPHEIIPGRQPLESQHDRSCHGFRQRMAF